MCTCLSQLCQHDWGLAPPDISSDSPLDRPAITHSFFVRDRSIFRAQSRNNYTVTAAAKKKASILHHPSLCGAPQTKYADLEMIEEEEWKKNKEAPCGKICRGEGRASERDSFTLCVSNEDLLFLMRRRGDHLTRFDAFEVTRLETSALAIFTEIFSIDAEMMQSLSPPVSLIFTREILTWIRSIDLFFSLRTVVAVCWIYQFRVWILPLDILMLVSITHPRKSGRTETSHREK